MPRPPLRSIRRWIGGAHQHVPTVHKDAGARTGHKEGQGRQMVWNPRTVSWCLLLLVASAAVATAHLRVQRTLPEAEAVLAESPRQIQVWFNQAPDPAISRLTLDGAAGAVALGETAVQGDKSLLATLPSELEAGAYTVRWRTAGDDGHTQRGDFAFTVRAAN